MTKKKYFQQVRNVVEESQTPPEVKAAIETFIDKQEADCPSGANVYGFDVGVDEELLFGVLDEENNVVLSLSYTNIDVITKTIKSAVEQVEKKSTPDNLFKDIFKGFGSPN